MQTNLVEYLYDSAKKFPEKTAFSDEFRMYSYKEINDISLMISQDILKICDYKNNAVAVLIDRNALCLCGFFGTLYSGNFYVPIDNKMPIQRIKKVIDEVCPIAIACLNSDLELAEQIAEENSINIINLNNICDNYFSKNDDLRIEFNNKTIDVDPAYVIYTSGSTGDPKGIVISHKSVIDFTEWMKDTFDFSSEDIMANQAPFYFDLSVKDIYTTIKNGATCHIIPKKTIMFPSLLIDFINEKKATSLIWATSCFNLVSNSKIFEKKTLDTVNKVILGGEALFGKHLNNWKKYNPNIKYVNLYGPTEVTVDCTYYIIDKEYKDEDCIPIGRACKNKEVLILDENLNKLSKNEVGEICVRGTGLAKGYFNDFEKTKNSFVNYPSSNYPDTIYKTGDLGYINDEGLIVFSSRKDGQIKHMGYRIELGEIERAINSCDQINESICFFDEKKDKIICIYSGNLDDQELFLFIQKLIPKYMFPNILKKTDEMPHNANGKIDRVKAKDLYFKEGV